MADFVSVFVETVSRLDIAVACSDGLTRHFTTIDDLRDYSNPRGARITSIAVRSHDSDLKSWTTLVLTSAGDGNIYLSIDAEEPVAIKTSEAFARLLDRVKPWYAFLATRSLYDLLIKLSFGVTIASFVWSGISYLRNPSQTIDLGGIGRGLYVGFILLAFLWFPLIVLEAVRVRMFPLGTFLIGDGSKRHHDLEFWRKGVLVGFVVSVGAGLALAVIGVA